MPLEVASGVPWPSAMDGSLSCLMACVLRGKRGPVDLAPALLVWLYSHLHTRHANTQTSITSVATSDMKGIMSVCAKGVGFICKKEAKLSMKL